MGFYCRFFQLLWLGRGGGGGGGGGRGAPVRSKDEARRGGGGLGGVLPSAAKMRRGVRKVFPVSKRKETVCG